MNEMIIDNHYIALKLIEALFHKGLINKATYENVKAKNPEVLGASKPDSFLEMLERAKKADAV